MNRFPYALVAETAVALTANRFQSLTPTPDSMFPGRGFGSTTARCSATGVGVCRRDRAHYFTQLFVRPR